MEASFKDGESFDFDLSSKETCEFLFGSDEEVVSFTAKAKISKVDIETNTIYLEPSDGG